MDLDSSQALNSSQQVCGNRRGQTVLTLSTATCRGLLRASSCPVRCLGNPSIFQKAKQELINRCISHFAPESVIMIIQRTSGLAAVKRVIERDGMWLVVGFHPVIYRTLRDAIASFQASKEMQECHEWAFGTKCPRIRIEWKNDMAAHRSINLQDVQAERNLRVNSGNWMNSE